MNQDVTQTHEVNSGKNGKDTILTRKVLCVDDDVNLLTGIQRNLRKQFDIDTAVGALAALKALETSGPYAVIVADMQMPGINGVEFLNITRQKYPDTVRVMLTGNADQKTASDAVNKGQVFQFVNKPCSPDKLAEVLNTSLKQYQLLVAERELLEGTLNGSVKVLIEILSLTDADSFGRSQALRDRSRDVCEVLKIQPGWELELASMLAQIGNVSVPPLVSYKARSGLSLTQEEKDILMRVPKVGSDLLAKIPRLKSVARIILYQDKNFDGTGFPDDDVRGAAIPMEARLLKALRDLASLESKLSTTEAIAAMRQKNGCYDPDILDALTRVSQSAPQAASQKSEVMNLADLRVGQLIGSNIKSSDGIRVLPAGTVITPLNLERLRNFASLSGLKFPIEVESPDPRLEQEEFFLAGN